MSPKAHDPRAGDSSSRPIEPVKKRATGIVGFDALTGGGLPADRLTAIIGSAGAGKTIFALQTLVHRFVHYGEACIFVAFEESVENLKVNAASFDWDHSVLDHEKFRFVDARIPIDAIMSGAFDLSGLVAVLSAITEEIGASNIVFDGIDMLLSGLSDSRLERQELNRLHNWIHKSKISALFTSKVFGIGDRDQERSNYFQYISDCIIFVEKNVSVTTASRTIMVSKYRGSECSLNPVPFLINKSGLDVLVFSMNRIDYPEFSGRISSGVPRLDALLNGGYLRGSSILISGSPGTSKTSLAASFVAAACAQGDRALFVSFDESGTQIVDNMKSIGLDLQSHIDRGLLVMASLASTGCAPEQHFSAVRDLMDRHDCDCLVIDPISAMLNAVHAFSVMICESLLARAKARGITVLCTSLLEPVAGDIELSASHISTVADTWIHVSYVAREGERNRALTIIKSRGVSHSNQVRELVLTAAGITVVDVYVADGEVLMGTARAEKEAEVRRLDTLAKIAAQQRRLELDRDLAELRTRIESATAELRSKEREAELILIAEQQRLEVVRSSALDRLQRRRAADDHSPAVPVADDQHDALS
jgi:circadian clock protein KaiC